MPLDTAYQGVIRGGKIHVASVGELMEEKRNASELVKRGDWPEKKEEEGR